MLVHESCLWLFMVHKTMSVCFLFGADKFSGHKPVSWYYNVPKKRISLDPIHAYSWGINQHWSRKRFGTQQLPRHYGRETHICVSKLGAIDSDNGLSPVRCQVIIWTNAGLILIGPLGSYLSEIVIKAILFKKKHWKCCLQNRSHLSRSQCVKVLLQCRGLLRLIR